MLPYSHVNPAVSTLLPQSSDLLRVAVAGRDRLARAGLSSLLGMFDDVVVIADDIDLDQAEARLITLTPDVVVCDLGTADPRAIQLAGIPALVLVPQRSDGADLIAGGMRGVIDRSASPKRIHAALRAVGEGLLVWDSMVSTALAPRESEEIAEPLTAREHEVLELLSSGLTNKEIAQRLGITEHTVKFHVNAILGKLAAETRTEAVVQAARRGLIVL
jgi:two-component system, NarL family, nitrate/nitrite response regulator NarL